MALKSALPAAASPPAFAGAAAIAGAAVVAAGAASCANDVKENVSIKAKLKISISEDIADWGITLKTVEIQDIQPSGTMQQAMEEQAAAERQRRATVTRADGEKTAAILEADGRLEASRRDAEAKVVLAEATKTALSKVNDAIQDKELPAMYLLGEKYIEAMRDMSNSDNSKLVVLPADIPAAVRGIMNNTK